MLRNLGILVALAISTTTAAAQRAPDMATLDRGDGISKFGIDLAYTSLDLPFYSGGLRFELYGQYVTDSGFGIYGALPISRSFDQDPDLPLQPEPATAFGNADLGMLYVAQPSPTFSWVFRGGLAVPTASDSGDGIATNITAFWPRMTDLALAVPDAWYIRLGISPLIHVSNVFLRMDVGFDLGIDDEDDIADELFRLNVGGGVDLGPVALSLELANTATLDEFDDGDEFIHTLAVTLRFMGEQLQPFLSIGSPIDDSARNTVDFFVAGGIQVAP